MNKKSIASTENNFVCWKMSSSSINITEQKKAYHGKHLRGRKKSMISRKLTGERANAWDYTHMHMLHHYHIGWSEFILFWGSDYHLICESKHSSLGYEILSCCSLSVSCTKKGLSDINSGTYLYNYIKNRISSGVSKWHFLASWGCGHWGSFSFCFA